MCFPEHSQEQFSKTKFATTEVHVDTSEEIIRFVKPGTFLEQDKPQGNPAHPFIRAVGGQSQFYKLGKSLKGKFLISRLDPDPG